MTASTDRQDTIRRAIALIDTAGPADLTLILGAQTSIHPNLRDDPARLRDILTAGLDASGFKAVSAWKGAQQVLAAYGLPT